MQVRSNQDNYLEGFHERQLHLNLQEISCCSDHWLRFITSGASYIRTTPSAEHVAWNIRVISTANLFNSIENSYFWCSLYQFCIIQFCKSTWQALNQGLNYICILAQSILQKWILRQLQWQFYGYFLTCTLYFLTNNFKI